MMVSLPSRDHPRSRGVYSGMTRKTAVRRGSSPLARGLLYPLGESVIVAGIIPARAGFTTSPAHRGRPAEDHPRSRGVYGNCVISSRLLAGSSPLARGLRCLRPRLRVGRGIIPARAGFTAGTAQTSHRRRGSSPLARGLRVVAEADVGDDRIIPARAGFTYHYRQHVSYRGDHPRSRGVYTPRPQPFTLFQGSSPLARGLLNSNTLIVVVPRIIPARAGFTAPSTGIFSRA